jgi:hypothetical protein
MIHRSTVFTQVLFITICLVLGCSKSGTFGCNGSDSSSAGGVAKTETVPKVDSTLPGVYRIGRYQGSQGACDQLIDIPGAPAYLVLYSFRPVKDADEVRLGGAFCNDVDHCRGVASEAAEPAIGYSFLSGSDASGWQGWGISGTGPEDEQCGADVQSHQLTAETETQAVLIKTKTVRTVFPPMIDGGVATCSNKDAIASVNDDLPCKALLLLKATLEAGL